MKNYNKFQISGTPITFQYKRNIYLYLFYKSGFPISRETDQTLGSLWFGELLVCCRRISKASFTWKFNIKNFHLETSSPHLPQPLPLPHRGRVPSVNPHLMIKNKIPASTSPSWPVCKLHNATPFTNAIFLVLWILTAGQWPDQANFTLSVVQNLNCALKLYFPFF